MESYNPGASVEGAMERMMNTPERKKAFEVLSSYVAENELPDLATMIFTENIGISAQGRLLLRERTGITTEQLKEALGIQLDMRRSSILSVDEVRSIIFSKAFQAFGTK